MFWDNIVGHDAVIRQLRQLVAAGKAPHALLFAGPSGIGKSLVAQAMAAAVLCHAPKDLAPCGVCLSCRQIRTGAHPDLFHFPADTASLKIGEMRAMQNETALAPCLGSRRVVILEDAQRMTTEAANSLLKILEEPNDGLMFILTAGSASMLLPTVVSRCRLFSFLPLSPDILAEALVAKGFGADAVQTAARLSGGRMGKALALLEPDGMAARDMALAILRRLQKPQAFYLWNDVMQWEDLKQEKALATLEHIMYILRDLVLLPGGGTSLLLNRDLCDELAEIAENWHESGLLRAITAVKETMRALAGNANVRLACEALLIKLGEYQNSGAAYATHKGA